MQVYSQLKLVFDTVTGTQASAWKGSPGSDMDL